jgi:hypothetical protein
VQLITLTDRHVAGAGPDQVAWRMLGDPSLEVGDAPVQELLAGRGRVERLNRDRGRRPVLCYGAVSSRPLSTLHWRELAAVGFWVRF